jgi:membrane protein required for colicin V production
MFAQATSSLASSIGSGINLATSTASLAKTAMNNPIVEKLSSAPLFDVVLGLVLLGFVIYGLYFGLIRTLGSLFGIIIGAWVASHFYLMVSEWLKSLFFGYNNLGPVLVFIILFFIINRLVCFVFVMIDRAFDILSIIPFLKSINHLAGAIFGLIEGALILGLIFYVSSRYAIVNNWFGDWLVQSHLVPYLTDFAKILLPLLPEALKKAQSLIK